ncbi:MAG TPA: DUF2520 domain-containing protein [Bacteroidota bacterium]|nr:DUF2520 domain-containing protein [Bacteroidota bacterium]
MTRNRWNIAIVGPGKVGLAFGKVLRKRGDAITAVIARSATSALRGGKYLRCANTGTQLELIPGDARVVLLTVPHSSIEPVARDLARLTHLSFSGMAFCHASGMLSAAALAPLADQGATVASFHPLQTFPRDFPPEKIVPTLPGIWYGVDGDAKGLRFAKQLASRLGGKTVVIPTEMREYYHAACVVASNHLTALLGVLEEMHRALDLSGATYHELFRPIIETTLRNVTATSPVRALSGPVARGGTETIGRHLETIRQHTPELLPYYAAMTLATVRLAMAKESIDEHRAAEFRGLVDAYHSLHPPSDKPR